MKIDSLNITGFGKLSNLKIGFGPEITVLLGSNEAGKSTIHRAIRTALYGIDAGSQGRPVEKSEWQRWRPWNGSTYGLVLTYTLNDGQQIRVARQLERRGHAGQVQEVGGADITNQMRVGREVLPGQVHLGISEAVFCASACLIEDSLRVDSQQATPRHAQALQQAVERLADSGADVTAQEALRHLAEAIERVGTSRRSASPLGMVSQNLSGVEAQILQVQTFTTTINEEQKKLEELQLAAAKAKQRQQEAERAWLLGRIAEIVARQQQLAANNAHIAELEHRISTNQRFSSFPLHNEESMRQLAEQIRPAYVSSALAFQKKQDYTERLTAIANRRSEIAAGQRALANTPRVGKVEMQAADELIVLLNGEAGMALQHQASAAIESKTAALHKEVAATGLGAITADNASKVAVLVDSVGMRSSGNGQKSNWVIALGMLLAGLMLTVLTRNPILSIILAGLIGTGSYLAWEIKSFVSNAPIPSMSRELNKLCPDLELNEAILQRIKNRIHDLNSLYEQLNRQQELLETINQQASKSRGQILQLARQSHDLATKSGVTTPHDDLSSPQVVASLSRLQEYINAVNEGFRVAYNATIRRNELAMEDQALTSEERSLHLSVVELEEKQTAYETLRATLVNYLQGTDIVLGNDAEQAIAKFIHGCSRRRQLETDLGEKMRLKEQVQVLGKNVGELQDFRKELSMRLEARGGNLQDALTAQPLGPEQLQRLEIEAEEAQQVAETVSKQADELRTQIELKLKDLPSLADLEDQRFSLEVRQKRAQKQLDALRLAEELIKQATRNVHRDIAPKLSQSITPRLSLITDGNYEAVNVDTANFAVSLQAAQQPELVPLEYLSHGTRDQVSLLLRMALTEVLSRGNEPVPMLLDEPLVTSDPQRRQRALEFLLNLGDETQIIITTNDPVVAELIQNVQPRAIIVELNGDAAEIEGRRINNRLQQPYAS